MSALLQVNDIHAAYGRAQALFGVSFEVRQGEVVTLLGRNGMGRSTAIKCIFGLLPVSKGQNTVCRASNPRTAVIQHCPSRVGACP
ncbi:ATP-binding cassette domain-containing protein [Pseudomonas aeruginosa]|uniref:ATP-binding cassette domain-containing protein n=1 Tax=Pseudomonas aeruginosa TaxID=287 RepID=UPI002A23F3B6|nr:ATP-binding cassette domain-containing protein [Pseudomonas aeruginosa]